MLIPNSLDLTYFYYIVGMEDNQKAEGDSAAQQHMLGYKS